MKKIRKTIYAAFILLSLTAVLSAKTSKKEFDFSKDQIFSFDVGYKGHGLRSFGWGLDLGYEKAFTDFTSYKADFSHMTSWNPWKDSVLTTVGLEAGAFVYPFGKKLNLMYVGAMAETDLFLYKKAEDKTNGYLMFVAPETGWKFNLWDVSFFEIFVNYKFQISPEKAPEDIRKYYKNGLGYGVKFKLNLGNLFKKKPKKEKE